MSLPKVRLSGGHLAGAAVILLAEILIASFGTGWVRHTLGDVFVVGLLYCLLRGVVALPRNTALAVVAVLALITELSQLAGLARFLGLEETPFGRLVLGGTFAPLDLVAYAIGLVLIAALEAIFLRRQAIGNHTT